VLSQLGPRDAAVNFGKLTYRSLQRHRAVFTAMATLFEFNNSINHGKITALNISRPYLLPLNSLFDSHCLRYKQRPFKVLKLYIVGLRYISLYD